jgi:hypothetical protein
LTLAHYFLRLGWLRPEGRVFGAAIQFRETFFCVIRVKDTSSEARAPLRWNRQFFALLRAWECLSE